MSAPVAVWQDLCLDALDPPRLGAFWAGVIGLRLDGSRPDNLVLRGSTPRHSVWINEVDRPKTVKNRLHLDVDCASIDDLVALGATVREPAEKTGFGWTGMADPEGHEFCAFVRRDPPAYRLHGIGVDCVDPVAQAHWWGALLGTEPTTYDGEDWVSLVGVAVDARMTLDFNAVPEPRVGPNRVHWDVVGDAEEIIAAGATHLWDTEHWRVLADPEGNEFCVFAPSA